MDWLLQYPPSYVSMEDIAEPIQIASQETSAMCRVSITVSVLQTRPHIAAPPRAVSPTTAAAATPRRTAAILARSAATGNAYNRRLRTVVTHQDSEDPLRPATLLGVLLSCPILCPHRIRPFYPILLLLQDRIIIPFLLLHPVLSQYI